MQDHGGSTSGRGHERRGAPRFRTQLGALVVPTDGPPRRGRVDDVSLGGMWIESREAPEPGTRCTVAVELGDHKWPMRAIAGRVVRRDPSGFAVQCFVDQRALAAELVERVVELQAAEQAAQRLTA